MTGPDEEPKKRWEGWLESPRAGEPIDRPLLTVAGWAFHRESPIREVTLTCGGWRQDLIPYGSARPDVARVYPGEPGAANSGFHTFTPIFAPRDADRLEIWATLEDDRQELLFSTPVSIGEQAALPSQSPGAAGEQAHPERPRVSVVIPCFNQGQYLDYAVDSVLAQTCQDLEILILDDGSTELETIRRIADCHRPRTRIFRTENRGLAAARNFLVSRAMGDVLCALDADDRLHPEYLAKALGRFEADPGLTFVSAWVQEFGDGSEVWRRNRCDLPALLAEDTVMTAALVRRDAVVAAGGYDEQMPVQGNEDWELWLRLVAAGHRGSIIPETLFYYRRRPGSMSTFCTRGSAHLDSVRYLFRKHAEAYRANLGDVLLWQDRRTSELLRSNDSLERERDGALRAEAAALRAELDRLTRRVTQARKNAEIAERNEVALTRLAALEMQSREQQQHLAAFHSEYERSCHEVRALRASLSWRLTAPFREIYDRLGILFGRRQP